MNITTRRHLWLSSLAALLLHAWAAPAFAADPTGAAEYPTPLGGFAAGTVPMGLAADGRTAVPCGSSLVVYGCATGGGGGGAVTNAGTFAVQAQQSGAWTVTVGAGSAAIGTVSLTGTLPAFASTPAFTLSGSAVVTNAGTFAVQNTAATPAGTNQIGSVSAGGFTTSQGAITPTIAASSHATGTSIGGLMSFTSMVRSTQPSGQLQRALVTFNDAQTSASLIVWLFSANPTSSTITDNSAFSIAAADVSKVITFIQVSNCVQGGTPTFCKASQQAEPYSLPSNGGTVYMAVQNVGSALTPTSTTDMSLTPAGLED